MVRTALLVVLIMSVHNSLIVARSSTLTQKELKRYKPLKVKEGRKLKSLKRFKSEKKCERF